jgi:tetratricopeptide (TPR) repeat protein
VNQGRTVASTPVGRSGNYCFRNLNGAGSTLIVAVEEIEVGRRDLPSGGASNQFRQDFAIDLGNRMPKAGVISAKYAYKREGRNADLFTSASAFLKEKKTDKAIPLLKEIVESDTKDFVASALLGSAYFQANDMAGAETAYIRSLEANPAYAVAMTNLGHIYLIQKKLDVAVTLLSKATEFEPDYARAFQLLGEAYLLSKKGKAGLEALYRAIEIDPVGMAECHLLAARLFESAGAKNYAAREYKLFLEKVPNYPEKKKLLKYIQDNPPAEN